MITVLDSCVWIDAKVFGGAAEAAVARALQIGVIAGCDQLWQEINWVLTRKYQWPPAIVMDDIMFFAMYSIHVDIDGAIRGSIDPGDDFILECAVRAKAHAIVSSDLKHLVSLPPPLPPDSAPQSLPAHSTFYAYVGPFGGRFHGGDGRDYVVIDKPGGPPLGVYGPFPANYVGSFECIPILTPEQYLIAPFAVDEEEIEREVSRTYARAKREGP